MFLRWLWRSLCDWLEIEEQPKQQQRKSLSQQNKGDKKNVKVFYFLQVMESSCVYKETLIDLYR